MLCQRTYTRFANAVRSDVPRPMNTRSDGFGFRVRVSVRIRVWVRSAIVAICHVVVCSIKIFTQRRLMTSRRQATVVNILSPTTKL